MPACNHPRRKIVNVVALTVFVSGLIVVAVAYGLSSSSSSAQQAASTLKMVAIVFRHGDRTPTETYASDPYSNYNWPDGWGALTKKGKAQLYTLGKELRKRYGFLVGEKYVPQDVLVQSSSNDRCLMSAQVFLAGFYPPVGDQVWNPDLLWQPIPVHSTPRDLDQLIVMKKPCPKYKEELQKAYNSPKILKLNQDNSDLYKYLSEHSGQDVDNITAVEFLYNTLEIEEQNNLTLPKWTKDVYPEKMHILAARSLALFSETELMQRLNGGPLAKQITQNMISKVNNTQKPNHKLFIYSAHDLTIVNLWRTFGFTQLLKPEYGASLLLELHSTTGEEHEVKMLYLKNTLVSEPELLNIPGCMSPCLLSTFLQLTAHVIPDNWNMECQQ